MDFVFRRSYRGPVKAVILDWAGTAVDYGSFAPAAVFLRLFESQGVVITTEDARSGMGLMKKDHLRAILARPPVAKAWQAAHGTPASEADVDILFQNFIPMQAAVLKDYAEPVCGVVDLVRELHDQEIKIGSTTGYTRAMMDVLAPEAARRGYAPDCIVCPDEVPAGRPYPWMCYQNAIALQVYPMEALVKVGDTLVDVEEGLNAGMWTVGLALTGNLLGLREEEVNALTDEGRLDKRERIEALLSHAGAHYVIDGIWELPPVLADIHARLARGERPSTCLTKRAVYRDYCGAMKLRLATEELVARLSPYADNVKTGSDDGSPSLYAMDRRLFGFNTIIPE
ncbi:MAG TPA: phosphonoacetaldehyde hydrolase [Anaerolineales bacterium]|nr:phosphonoacetaldehyde hydrolase [Anaerolineales bacterium]